MKKDKKIAIIIIIAIIVIIICAVICFLLFIINSSNDEETEVLNKTMETRNENAKLEAKEGASLAYMSLRTLIIEKNQKDSNYNATEDIENLFKYIKENLVNLNNTKGWKKVEIEDNNKIIMIYTSNDLEKDLKYTIILNDKSATMDDEPTEIDKNDTNNEWQNNISNIEDMEKKAFNNRFEPYIGDSVKGSQVNALIEAVRANNKIEESREVRVKANVSNWDYASNKASSNSNYKVTGEYDDDGYIKTIILEDADR